MSSRLGYYGLKVQMALIAGYLVAPYIWLWMLARLPLRRNTWHLRKFLRAWEFNDYKELLNLETGKGLSGINSWQSFEVFCWYFRILRSLGFDDGQEVPLNLLHSGANYEMTNR